MEKEFQIFINFKTYPQGTGLLALELASICQKVSQQSGIVITPVVQVVDAFRISSETKSSVWVQNADFSKPGANTGFVSLEALLESGVAGILLNHSEHPIPQGTIKQVLSRIKKEDQLKNIKTMVCCKTLGQIEKIAKLKPSFIAYEIADLIGGKISITDYDPKAVSHAVKLCKDIPLIVGAGIHQDKDLLKARELGAGGVLISSAIVLAENPLEKLNEIIKLLV